MDWIIVVGLFVSVVTLVVAGIGTWLAYLNHLARKQAELPKIQLYETGGVYHFRLETDHRSVGWKVIRVEVVHSDYGENVIAQTLCKKETWEHLVTTSSYTSEWRQICEYPEGAGSLALIFFHNNCMEAALLFTCETPSRVWLKPWEKKKKFVHYQFVRGTQPPWLDDPYVKDFFGSV